MVLASVLEQLMERPTHRYTPGLLSRLSGVPKTTIVNWLNGRVARPRHWGELVRVADALRLGPAELDQLLGAAGYPPTAALLPLARDQAEQRLLGAWHRIDVSAAPRRPAPPAPATPLIGREAERAAIGALLSDPVVRLVTLTGPAGVGKTRLALQLAADMISSYAGECCFVALAALADPSALVETIARALGSGEQRTCRTPETLAERLRGRRLLLILDTCEHLPTAAALVSRLLAAAPDLTILVTSRVVLRVAGEQEVVLPPLGLPDLLRLPAPAELARIPAVALFLARVRAICPDVQLSATNAALVAAICVRLDGLPLAIELAAARTKLLPLRDLLARLDQRLSFLTVAYSDRLPHQQTLRGTLDWSYRLLPAAAQHLLTRLAIFAGSWNLAAAEAVCADTELARAGLLETLATLIDHSLVQTHPGDDESRYSLLETVRIYALDHLTASGERDTLETRHAAYYAGLAEQSAAGGPAQAGVMAFLGEERGNPDYPLAWVFQHEPDRSRVREELVADAPRPAAPLARLPLVGGAV